MTNLQIRMMLHYQAMAEPYALRDPAHATSLAVTAQREYLIELGYLERNNSLNSGYYPTAKGLEYVERLKAMV